MIAKALGDVFTVFSADETRPKGGFEKGVAGSTVIVDRGVDG